MVLASAEVFIGPIRAVGGSIALQEIVYASSVGTSKLIFNAPALVVGLGLPLMTVPSGHL